MQYQSRLSFVTAILAQDCIGVNWNIDNIYVWFKSLGWSDLGLPTFPVRLIESHDRRPARGHGRHPTGSMTRASLGSAPLERLELRLEGMAYGGDAFGRDADGRMVFVPFALPGERVAVQVVEAHAHWCRARMLEVLEPSADRVTPRCRHFGTCGGCHYQHIDPA